MEYPKVSFAWVFNNFDYVDSDASEEELCGRHITTISHVSPLIESQYSNNADGSKRNILLVTLNLIIGKFYLGYVGRMFLDESGEYDYAKEVDRRYLWGFKEINGVLQSVPGFRPQATALIDVSNYEHVIDRLLPGTRVSVSIGWRQSHAFPGKGNFNPDFPNDATKIGLKLDVIPNSLRILEDNVTTKVFRENVESNEVKVFDPNDVDEFRI